MLARLVSEARWQELLRLMEVDRQRWAERMELGRQRYEARREEERFFRLQAAAEARQRAYFEQDDDAWLPMQTRSPTLRPDP